MVELSFEVERASRLEMSHASHVEIILHEHARGNRRSERRTIIFSKENKATTSSSFYAHVPDTTAFSRCEVLTPLGGMLGGDFALPVSQVDLLRRF